MAPSVFDPLISALPSPTPRAQALPRGGTLQEWATQMASALPADTVLCGWSLGGMLALQLARTVPLKALILINTTPCFVQTDDWPHASSAQDFTHFKQAFHQDPSALLRHFIQLQNQGEPNPRAFGRQLAAHLIEDTTSLGKGLEILAHTDLRNTVSELPTLPTLILHGSEDRVIPSQAGHWLAAALPHATLFTLPNAGHALPVSQPQALAQIIHTFLSRLP
jgi:pimeloyl-[acyl-carrier protein] methyl ester esterase